jgi:hypothetical protein
MTASTRTVESVAAFAERARRWLADTMPRIDDPGNPPYADRGEEDSWQHVRQLQRRLRQGLGRGDAPAASRAARRRRRLGIRQRQRRREQPGAGPRLSRDASRGRAHRKRTGTRGRRPSVDAPRGVGAIDRPCLSGRAGWIIAPDRRHVDPAFQTEEVAVEVDTALAIAGDAGVVDGPTGLLSIGERYLSRQTAALGGGSTEMARNVIGERILGFPRELAADRGVPFNEVKRSRS